jgi:hypothetical protein
MFVKVDGKNKRGSLLIFKYMAFLMMKKLRHEI